MRSLFYVSIVFSGVLEVARSMYPIDGPITNQPVLELVFFYAAGSVFRDDSSSWMRPAENIADIKEYTVSIR